jgi:hypothetical protein
MKLDKWNGPLTLLANLGVVIGLAVVVVEIRQTQQIAVAQARFELASFWRSLDEARLDPTFATVFAKSLTAPESLSLEEKIQLDAYYWGYLDQLYNLDQAHRSGVREPSVESAVIVVATYYMSNRYAHVWWQAVKESMSNEDRDNAIHDMLDRALASQDLSEKSHLYRGYSPSLMQD